jgi:hypothetical protein
MDSNSVSARRPFSNNQWFQEETFFIPMDDERYVIIPAATPNPPTWIHLKSPMKIPVFNPYKTDIEIEWITPAGTPLVFGNPIGGADNPLLQTYVHLKLTSCCDEGACNNESKIANSVVRHKC